MPKKRRSILLFDIIDEYSTKDVIDRLLELNNESNDDPINLIISSPGGYVSYSFGVIDIMTEIKAEVNTFVLGDAASAAAVIAAAGAKRFISENSRMMLHQVTAGAYGKLSELQQSVLSFTETNDKLFNLLAKYTGKTKQELDEKIGDDDIYFSAQEAINYGLVDGLLTEDKINSFKLSEIKSFNSFNEINLDNKLSIVELLKIGDFYDERYGDFSITNNMFKQFIENFDNKVTGTDISMDITHENDNGEKEAVGWIKNLNIDNDKLVASVLFNKKGQGLISEKSFKYASAEYVNLYLDENGKPHNFVLKGAILTNRPVIKNNPIKLSDKINERKVENMDKNELIVAFKKHGVDVLALEASNLTLITENNRLKADVVKFESDSKKLADLTEKALSVAKEQAFNKLVTDKKELPARKELVMSHYKTAESLIEAYKDTPVLMHTKAIGDEGSDDASLKVELTDAEQALVDSKEFTKDEILYARNFMRKADED